MFKDTIIFRQLKVWLVLQPFHWECRAYRGRTIAYVVFGPIDLGVCWR